MGGGGALCSRVCVAPQGPRPVLVAVRPSLPPNLSGPQGLSFATRGGGGTLVPPSRGGRGAPARMPRGSRRSPVGGGVAALLFIHLRGAPSRQATRWAAWDGPGFPHVRSGRDLCPLPPGISVEHGWLLTKCRETSRERVCVRSPQPCGHEPGVRATRRRLPPLTLPVPPGGVRGPGVVL